jgi:hypothetical protein
MADMSPVEAPCLGCDRLLAILQRSALLRAELSPEPEPEPDLSSSGILARLLAGRKLKPEHDWGKAAAGDRDE